MAEHKLWQINVHQGPLATGYAPVLSTGAFIAIGIGVIVGAVLLARIID